MAEDIDFLAGVVEGFYGQPWSRAERLELFDWMAAWGLNTYLYAPKDDLHHRTLWREPYSNEQAAGLGEIIHLCQQRGIQFIYALGPGLDIRFHDGGELGHLSSRFEQMLKLGCHHFALLFDDIPDQMAPEDLKRWRSFASAQSYVANAMFRWVRERCPDSRFLFCPTPYCGRMKERGLGGADYLATLGRELLGEIDVFWTGPEIISAEITVPHVRELQSILRRKPLVWDNLHANDYDGRRFYCGPYTGRALELRREVAGLLTNPNNEFPLNFVPLRTLAQFVNCPGDSSWEPRKAYLSAMREWLPRFATVSAGSLRTQDEALDDLVLLGDCYYLPYEQGAEADALCRALRDLLAAAPHSWGETAVTVRKQLARLRVFCQRMTELQDRPLFYALSRRVWELREELDLLERYLEFRAGQGRSDAGFTSDFHQPGTYRGGIIPLLQRLLVQHPDGTFTPAQLFKDKSNRT
jgi:protein O-GlcNAcase/histone acetyltransferase